MSTQPAAEAQPNGVVTPQEVELTPEPVEQTMNPGIPVVSHQTADEFIGQSRVQTMDAGSSATVGKEPAQCGIPMVIK